MYEAMIWNYRRRLWGGRKLESGYREKADYED
jgi:hypothetical protein